MWTYIICTILLTARIIHGTDDNQTWNISDCFVDQKMDLLILLDTSIRTKGVTLEQINLDSSSFSALKYFASHVVKHLDVSQEKTRVALIRYDRRPIHEFGFHKYNNNKDVIENIYRAYITKIIRRSLLRKSLRYIKQKYFFSKTRLASMRPGVPFVLLILTDDKFNDEPKPLAQYLKRLGAKLIVVATPNASKTQLKNVASHPIERNLMFKVDPFEFSFRFVESGLANLCEIVQNYQQKSIKTPNFKNIKKSIESGSQIEVENQTILQLLRSKVSQSTISLTWSLMVPNPIDYIVDYQPRYGKIVAPSLRNDTTRLIVGLRASTSYMVVITPLFEDGQFGRGTVFIFQTSEPPVFEVNIELESNNECPISTSQMVTYASKFDVSESECMLNYTNIRIYLNRGEFSNQISISPEISRLSLFQEEIEHGSKQIVFGPVRAGVKYDVVFTSAFSQGFFSDSVIGSAVVPPQPPYNVSAKFSSGNEVVVKWRSPSFGRFDAFRLLLASPYGSKYSKNIVISRTTEGASEDFNYTFTNVISSTEYLVSLHTLSDSVISSSGISISLKTYNLQDSPGMNFINSALISAEDGIYIKSLEANENSSPVQKMMDIGGGVVNSVYHRRLIDSSDASSTWVDSVIWIDRLHHDIKVTEFVDGVITTSTLISGLLQPVGLKIDNYDNAIYWTDIASRTIGVATLNYSHISNLPENRKLNRRLVTLENSEIPIGITLNPIERFLFWSDSSGKITRSEMDGNEKTILIQNPLLRINTLAHSLFNNRVYWFDSSQGQLMSMNSDGTNILIEERGQGNNNIYLSASGKQLYWLNGGSNILNNLNFGAKNNETVDSNQLLDGLVNVSVSGISVPMVEDYERAILLNTNLVGFPCQQNDIDCTEICVSTTLKDSVCTGQCFPWEMLCYNSTGICINSFLKCDGIADCPNGDDELLSDCDVTNVCEDLRKSRPIGTQFFQCQNRLKCVDYSSVCDGRLDCRDGSDEENCPSQYQSCNFDADLCLWEQDSRDDFDWKRMSGRTPSNFTGPHFDHTQLTPNSSYIYAEATPQNIGSTTRLISAWLIRPACLRFSYFMLGDTVDSLVVKMRSRNSDRMVEVWSMNGNQGIFWKDVKVSIKQQGLYQIIFESVRGGDYRSDVAIDDVIIEDGLCESEDNCDFQKQEYPLCGYTDTTSVTSPGWLIGTGELVANSDSLDDILTEDNFVNPFLDLGSEWFYFNFKYDDTPGCSVCNGTQIVRELTSYGSPKYAGLVLCDTTKYKIYLGDDLLGAFMNIGDGAGNGEDHCEFVGGDNFAYEVGDFMNCKGSFAFTRLRWNEPVSIRSFGVSSRYFTPAYYRCDVLIPQSVVNFDPETITSEANRFLVFDHYSASSNVGRLVVPVYKASSNGEGKLDLTTLNPLEHRRWCLSFRYSIHGESTLELKINNDALIWKKYVNNNEGWNEAIVILPAPDVKYDLQLITKIGSAEGYVAIDDVIITREPCSQPQVYTCDFNKPVNKQCAFILTKDDIEYINVDHLYERDPFDPRIISDQSEKATLVTSNSVFDVSDLLSIPIIETPQIPAISEFYDMYCLIINYKQKAPRDGAIGIIIRSSTSNQWRPIAEHALKSTTQVLPWLHMRVEINSSIEIATSGSFILEFHGLMETLVNSISLSTSNCPKEEGFCNNQVLCSNKNCVDSSLLCDGRNDCGDWSDEIGCDSNCGGIADIFGTQNSLLVESNSSLYRRCSWRIHGQSGKHVLLKVEKFQTLNNDESLTLKVYRGLSGEMLNNIPALTKTKFLSDSVYLIDNHDATVILEVSSSISMFRPMLNLQINLVEKDHCHVVCSDRYCVTDNFICDGIVGCPNEEDETTCTRFANIGNEQVLEVRRYDDQFQVLCGDNMTSEIADLACRQEGYWRAEQPLRFIQAPPDLKFAPYILGANSSVAAESSQYLQRLLMSSQLSGKQRCRERRIWVASCQPFQCGLSNPEENIASRPMLRVVGGDEVKRGRWPWMVSVALRAGNMHRCGGTIISDKYVLTAAHCFDKNSSKDFIVVAGSNHLMVVETSEEEFDIIDDKIHPEYNPEDTIPDWDIAILELDRKIKFSRYISPACLPGGNLRFRPGRICHLAGFGHREEHGMHSRTLISAVTQIISRGVCDSGFYKDAISTRMICAGYPLTGGTGICNGDSGGPLVCEESGSFYLVGIVSWSIGCALRGKPDVLTDVQFFIEWINLHTNMSVPIPSHIQPGTCGGTYFNQTNGHFASPGWPGTYPNDQKCTYRIIAGLGQTVQLEFDTFQTEQNYDFIAVFRTGVSFLNLISQFSGSNRNAIFTVQNATMEVLFTSDTGIIDAGFLARWTIVGEPTDYSGNIFPISIERASTTIASTFSLVAQFLGDFYPIPQLVGRRPAYEQSALTMSIDGQLLGHRLYYKESLGQWRVETINPTGEGLVSWLYANDSSSLPNQVTAEWQLWTGLAWRTAKLNFTDRPDLQSTQSNESVTTQPTTDILEETASSVDKNIDSRMKTTMECISFINSDSELIELKSTNASNCLWRVLPPSSDSVKFILLEVNSYELSKPLIIYEGDATSEKQPIFELKGSYLDNSSMSNQTHILTGSGDIEMTTAVPAVLLDLLSEEEVINISEHISQDQNCFESFLQFSSNPCAGKIYQLFDLYGDAIYLFNCSLLGECSTVNWCDLLSLIESISVTSFSALNYSTFRFCSDPTWNPMTDSLFTLEDSSGDNKPATQKKQILVYEDTSRNGLSLVLDMPEVNNQFSISYKISNDFDSVMYSDYQIEHLQTSQHHRVARAVLVHPLLGGPSQTPLVIGNSNIQQSSPPLSVLNSISMFSMFNQPTVFPLQTRSSTTTISTTTLADEDENAQFSSVVSTCRNTATQLNQEGTRWGIFSPNYPNNYPYSSNCLWTLTTLPGHQIVLNFTELSLEAHVLCRFDSVTLYDGPDTSASRIGIFCDASDAFIFLQVSSENVMTLKFTSDHVVNNRGFYAIVSTQPIALPVPNYLDSKNILFSCDFAKDFCGFVHETTVSNFKWWRNQLSTDSDKTGPPYDASSDGMGYYIFIETSMPRIAGDHARIITPTLPAKPDQPLCLKFAYDMYGKTIGILNVYVLVSTKRTNSKDGLNKYGIENVKNTDPLVYLYGINKRSSAQGTQSYLLWSKAGAHRGANQKPWVNVGLTFYPYNDFQIVFEGVRGRTYQSDLAIDNIVIFEGTCGNDGSGDDICQTENGFHRCGPPPGSNDGECILMEQICDGKVDCQSGSDEMACQSTLRTMCRAERLIPIDTTIYEICKQENVDRCGLRSLSLTRVHNFTCDQIYDCFGGYDESFCDVTENGQLDVELKDSLTSDCGEIQPMPSDDNETVLPVTAQPGDWPWLAGLYVVRPPSRNTRKSFALGQVPGDNGYTFLCSVVFVRQNWVIVPAHCLLDPTTYASYVADGVNDGSDVVEDIGLAEFDAESAVEDVAIEEGFTYVVISPKGSKGVDQLTWRVKKSITHPDFNPDELSSNGNKSKNSEDDFDELMTEFARVNYDIALLSIEQDEDVLTSMSLEETPEFENVDITEVEEEEIFYDAQISNFTIQEPQSSAACFEIPNSISKAEEGSSVGGRADSGLFKLPLELERLSMERGRPDSGLPIRATCYLVGHSPMYNSGDEQTEDISESSLTWGLRQQKVPVTSSEISARRFFCDLFKDSSTRETCMNELDTIQPTRGPSSVKQRLSPLLLSGYKGVKSAAFVQDPGLAVFCQHYDGRWFLNGLYNWLSLRKSDVRQTFSTIVSDMHAFSFARPESGVPLGNEYFTKLTPKLTEWMDDTLQDVCPGEFSCYAPSSAMVQCIKIEQVCDGIIDCPNNYLDELNCNSGCSYNADKDHFNVYYTNLKNEGVILPDDVYIANNVTNDATDPRRSWLSDVSDGKRTVRFNQAEGDHIEKCRWLILPEPGKVAIIRVPKMSANPDVGDGLLQVTTDKGTFTNDWTTGPNYYASISGQPIQLMLSPPFGKQYLTYIRNQQFTYYMENEGNCEGQHACADGMCVSPEKVCDGVLDCEDYSDELACQSGCEGRRLYNGLQGGDIISKNYPSSYTGNGDCVWLILAPRIREEFNGVGHVFVFHFDEFETSLADELLVYVGTGNAKILRAKYSGSEYGNLSFSIQAQQVTLVLESNDGIANRKINGTFQIRQTVT